MIAVLSQARTDALDVAGYFFVVCLGLSAVVGVGLFLRSLQLAALERWDRHRSKRQRIARYEAEYRDRLRDRADRARANPLGMRISREHIASELLGFDREARA